jgi:hypothetical protein
MGRVGSCYDNAAAESFFATPKTEIGQRVWATRQQARQAVFAYLAYYNHDRLHSTSVFTGISRNHLDRLVAELAEPFHTAREGRLHRGRGGRGRRRWPGAGHPETQTHRY